MATATGPRKTISIYDYPEHLNPFREDDSHRLRFWTIGRKLNRSNSINFSGIKDLKNSWAFRSFMKKGKKGQTSSQDKTNQVNGETSPIMYRRAIQYSSSSTSAARSTVASPERADRYVYGGSVTPLPRSRFQERLRSSSQNEVNSLSITPRMAQSEVSGSRLSVESVNPFEEPPVPPVRASRRKKKRAPLPPPDTVADVTVSSENSELQISEVNEKKASHTDGDLEIDEMNLNIELKIVEEEDDKRKSHDVTVTTLPGNINISNDIIHENLATSPEHKDEEKVTKHEVTNIEVSVETTEDKVSADSKDPILKSVSFPKIDIAKYRRNSSVNEDDIRLRRGNLEDFHLSNKRCKSLTNASDVGFITYDINLNESSTTKDTNGNEEPQKVVCKLYNETRKQSIDNSISSTEREFNEIDKVRREIEKDIIKLNAALEDDFSPSGRLSVSDIKRKFDNSIITSPNPIPKPRRSNHSEPGSPVNSNFKT